MRIRRATPADREVVRQLYHEFFAERPPEPYWPGSIEDELREVDEIVSGGIAVIAEDEGGPIGFALARIKGPRLGRLTDLYVRPAARRRGGAKALLREVVRALRAAGIDHVSLDVDVENTIARNLYERLGFRPRLLDLVAELDELDARLADNRGPSFGSVHVQTDDAVAVERAVSQFMPRLGPSRGTAVSAPRNGWVAVYDELCDREPSARRRLARELSDRMGAVVLAIGLEAGTAVRYLLLDRGRVADEYASLPEFHGPLPPGDVVALRANPTVAARLTGADPARLRQAAPTGASPGELPPPHELLAAVAAALGIAGAEHGYAGARR